MKHTLAIRIAWRYIFSRKSHSAVNAISIISVCGVAVATIAIVCVLSVFNGFKATIESKYSMISPDLLVRPAEGDVIANADSIAESIKGMAGVKGVTPVVMDNAILYRDGSQFPVMLLGARPEVFDRITRIKSILLPGSSYEFADETGKSEPDTSNPSAESVVTDIEEVAAENFDESALFADPDQLYSRDYFTDSRPVNNALLSVGVAMRLGLSANPASWHSEGVTLFVPRRTASVNLANPASSFRLDSLAIVGIYESQQSEFDTNTVIVDLDIARSLFEFDNEANRIYVGINENSAPQSLKKTLSAKLGSNFEVLNRDEQETLNFKMVSIEKWITFLLLSFILLIASFNIISTLAMFIIEKRKSIKVISNLGAPKSMVGGIFAWESFIVCMTGSLAGLLIGIILCLIQQYFGLIKIGGGGNMIIDVYPVKIMATDILIVLIPSILIALFTAIISSRYSKKMIDTAVPHE